MQHERSVLLDGTPTLAHTTAGEGLASTLTLSSDDFFILETRSPGACRTPAVALPLTFDKSQDISMPVASCRMSREKKNAATR
jgi:hypothetical protein